MAKKKVTVLLMPQGAKRVRQIEISKVFFVLVPFLVFSGALLLAAIIRDYIAVKKEIPRFAHLHKENAEQKEQLVALAQEIEVISKSLEDLKKLDNKLRAMVNLETREDRTQFLGIGGSGPLSLDQAPQSEKGQRRLVRLMHDTLSDIRSEISLQKNEKIELSDLLETQKSILACTPSIWPARGWVSSTFGNRISPFTNEKEFHSGMDISAKAESPIISAADGVVLETGTDYGYGKVIRISHGHGYKTTYAHVSRYLVKPGQRVKRGQQIATVGSTGRSTGPHLHYEISLNGLPVNPNRYILN
ncbi:MAG: M23 family metallopeptidase [Desulfobacteraceae bacterium]|nr:MAG: M23 family metallopeptidase [Desulfobacteraceae bacterium]